MTDAASVLLEKLVRAAGRDPYDRDAWWRTFEKESAPAIRELVMAGLVDARSLVTGNRVSARLSQFGLQYVKEQRARGNDAYITDGRRTLTGS